MYICIFVYLCVYLCTFLYISVYSHLSSKDAPRDLLQNERLESFCGGLSLGIRPFFFFVELVDSSLVDFSLIFRRTAGFFVDVSYNW